MRYTTDGTEPTDTSSSYSSAITVADTLTVKARAYKTGWTSSDSGHASYWVSSRHGGDARSDAAGGTQTSPRPYVSMSTTYRVAPRAIHARRVHTDCSCRRSSCIPFVVPVTTTVKVKAFKAGLHGERRWRSVTVRRRCVTGATATPSIVPRGGMYATAQDGDDYRRRRARRSATRPMAPTRRRRRPRSPRATPWPSRSPKCSRSAPGPAG